MQLIVLVRRDGESCGTILKYTHPHATESIREALDYALEELQVFGWHHFYFSQPSTPNVILAYASRDATEKPKLRFIHPYIHTFNKKKKR